MNNTVSINLFAPPGSGKTTMAAALFAELKMIGLNAEYVQEYAKSLAWKYGSEQPPQEEIDEIPYVQASRMRSLFGKVDIVVTDAPLLQGSVYQPPPPVIYEVVGMYTNINVYIQRTTAYDPIGRWQTEEESNALAEKIKSLVNYDLVINSDRVGLYKLITYVLSRVNV